MSISWHCPFKPSCPVSETSHISEKIFLTINRFFLFPSVHQPLYLLRRTRTCPAAGTTVAPATPRSPPTRGASAATASPAISGKSTNQSTSPLGGRFSLARSVMCTKGSCHCTVRTHTDKSMYCKLFGCNLNLLTLLSFYIWGTELFSQLLNVIFLVFRNSLARAGSGCSERSTFCFCLSVHCKKSIFLALMVQFAEADA